jgi:hypothetical protein
MFKMRAALACVAALSLSACGGGVEMEEAVPETAVESVEQPLIYACDGSREFIRRWYTNGVETGREECYCDGSLYEFGTIGGRYTQQIIRYCR